MAKYTCCTGQTECNHIVTIGYLKSFIGNNIKTTGGTTVNVDTSKPDSYVPTYSELTNGSMLPLFVDGGSGKWHDNVDGIIINGSYVSDQNVKQEDLELVYTRFKSLSISASKTSFSECFDSTDICATYTLTKTVKTMNDSCTTSNTSADGADTLCKLSFSASCEWISIGNCSNNCVTITAGKNGSWSANSRSCTITASVNYKGEAHSSNNITIVQNALTGGYYVRNFKERVYDGVSITNHSSQYYGCEGGNFNVTAIGSYHDLYMWEDSCGIIYDRTPYSSITGTESAGSESGVFNKILCPTEHETHQTALTINYHGYSDSVSFYQDCTQTCQCDNVTSCTRTCSATSTVDACGGDVPLSGTQICDVDVYGWNSSGNCVYISSTTVSRDISTVVTIEPNTTQQPKTHTGTKDYIDYTITQPAGPCGGCTGETASTVWGSYEIPCSSATTLTINVPYSSVTEYGNCETVIVPHTSAITLTNITCNSGGVRVIRDANPRITQAGGCQCCDCNDLTMGSDPSNWTWNDTTAKSVPFTANSACITNITASSSTSSFTASIVGNSVSVAPTGNNTSTTAKEATIKVSYKSDGTDCYQTFPVEQNPYGCSCGDLSIGATAVTWSSYDDVSTKTVTYTANSECITNISVTSDTAWFSASVNTGTSVVTITPSGQNTTLTAKTGTVTINYKSNGSNCSKTVNVSQPAYVCACSDLTLGSNPSNWTWNDTAAKTVPFTANSVCISNITASSSDAWFTASIVGNSVSIAPTGQNSTATAKTATITVAYKTNGVDCSKTILVEQNPYGCSCGDLSISPTSVTWSSYDDVSTKTVSYTANSACITDISVTSDTAWFTATLGANSISITPSGNNMTLTAKTGTVTINYKSNGTSCSGTVSVTQPAYVCACEDLTIGNPPSNWAYNDTAAKTVPFTANSICISNITANSSDNWFTASIVGSSVSIAPTGQNTTTVIKEATVTVAYKTNGVDCSQQIPVKQNPYGCSCGDLSIGATAVTWSAWNDTAAKTVSYTANSECITDVSVTSDTAWFSTSVNTSTKVITITPSGQNTTLTAKTGTVTVNYKSNGASCSGTVSVTQPAYVCSCSDLTMGSDPSSWAWNDTTAKSVGFTANSECISVTSVSSSTNWFTASIVGNSISIAPTGQNTSDSAKTATVLLYYSSNGTNCTGTVEVRQEAYVCSCDNLTLTANTIPCSGGTNIVIGMYNSNTCVTDLSGTSNQGWITGITFNNGNIYATVEANPYELVRTASISISYNANGSACTARAMIVIQREKCCDCDDFNVNTTPIKFSNATTSSTESISYTATSCMNVTAFASTSVTGLVLSIASVANGVVTVNMINDSYPIPSTDTKIGTVTVSASYTEGSSTTNCSSYTVDVYIEGTCSMYTLTSDNTVDCSGGTITFNFS